MNHKQYENLILTEVQLTGKQQTELAGHLQTCKQCQQLSNNWAKSLQMINSAAMIKPTTGFTKRWEIKLTFEKKKASVRKVRLTILISVISVLGILFGYLLFSQSFSGLMASMINTTSRFIFAITDGVLRISDLFNSVPRLVRWTAGVFFIGIANLFMVFSGFFLWKLRKKQQEYRYAEVSIEK